MSGGSLRRATAVAAMALLAACGGGDSSTLPTLTTTSSTAPSPEPTTTTTVTATTTTSTTTTSTTTTSAVSATTTSAPTTTAAPGAALVIRSDRLGAATFGSSADSAVAYVTGVLGAPSDDTGWQDVRTLGEPCPGEQVRFVTWGDGLTVFLTDSGPAATEFRHLAGFTFETSETMTPAGPATEGGVTLGSTVRALQAAHPGTSVYVDEAFGAAAETPDGRVFHLSGTSGTDSVVGIAVGAGCGE